MTNSPSAQHPWFGELHCKSNYSFLTGASHPEELVFRAETLGYKALAITDECSLAGVVRAYTAIRDQQLSLTLIVGSEITYQGEKLILLCPSRTAYGELARLITQARMRSEKGHYQVMSDDFDHIKHCLCIWLPTLDHEQNNEKMPFQHWLKNKFDERLWIGAERLLLPDESRYLTLIETLASSLALPIVCTNDILMHHPRRQPLLDVLTAIRLRKPLHECGLSLPRNGEQALKPLDKITKLYPQAWIQETASIVKRCNFCLSELRYEYPAELVPDGYTVSHYLRHLVEQGIKLRFPDGIRPDIRAIIEKELVLIAEQKYEFFFLTIYDIVQFAKSQGILYQGRGSAANSVVCYCLEITAVNPDKVNVLFERFISKERDEPPDIDVDFEHERREEIFQYIYQKYGRQRAALAATVITYRFKSAFRDVGKALGINETQLDYYIKNLNHRDKELDKAEQLKALGLDIESHHGRWLLELVEEIRGFPRHLSQHVGGFIISAGPLYELVPIENAAMAERSVIQWDKDDLESLGLLKVDILALGMLSAIRKAFAIIRQHDKRALSISDITAMGDDPQVYQQLQKGDSVGVFQVESRAQINMLPRLRPACYYDLVIQIAIVRPGPIQGDMVHPYLKRRWGKEAVSYPSKEVESVLSRTMGVPIFQEQVIQLAMVAAGFSGGEADQLRRAMAAWKRSGKLAPFREKLINGMQERGYDIAFAEQIFKQIQGFGEYGFPESHSASFAVLAYTSSWLKHYYPVAFYCALLNSQPMGFYSPSQLLQDANRHGVKILPVCVNCSDWDHQQVVENHQYALRLGLRLINGFSAQGGALLLSHRPIHGFQHINELRQCGMNRGDLQALASANATQVLANNRFSARWQMMDDTHTLPLLANTAPTDNDIQTIQSPTAIEDVIEDYAAIGLTLGKHPIALLDESGKLGKHRLASELSTVKSGSAVTVAGIVTGRQRPGTASGVTFMTLEDQTGNINVVVWLATARAQNTPFVTAKILKIKGILEREGEVVHIIAGRLIDMTSALDQLLIQARDFH
ncbi:error-prone DNA polymerase [Enterovibrio sp. ZSDZ42]|uniref:Error-prone DNA polymerase n=1 Tax=Enterovibrio gelatinilyticus TaxID=2899819 RepID=A0ABT5R4U3_9GAMM|nr:error-prone DNA polymerase [Enterovibrio sp. ZSDZ42]MDD1795286.1 error-prone DNA polymerase [Enterovibrio sp. ZSDZ42]